jgi:transcription initiation factor TFIIB
LSTITRYEPERVSTADEAETRRRTAENERLACPECGGRLARDSEHGETVCGECGLVVAEDEVDRGPEWRSLDGGEDRRRVGAPTTKLMHDKGLSTNIGWQDRDASGHTLSSRQRVKMQRLRTWDERFRTRNSKERNLKQALGEIDRMGSALGLPENVRETASVIYRRALAENLLPGRSIEGIATASVYAALRQAAVPRTVDDVTAVSRVDGTEFTRAYRYLVRELRLEIQPPNPTDYLPKFASDLDVNEAVEARAAALLEGAMAVGAHSGKSPVGLAAAALYAAGLLGEEHLTQEAVSAVTNVSEVTIRNRYRELLELAEGTGETDEADGTDEAEPAAA